MHPCQPALAARAAAAALTLLVLTAPARAGLEELLYNFQMSDFQFGMTGSNVPYPPLSWFSTTYYDETEFESSPDAFGNSTFRQQDFSQALILPVYIASRDMFVLGEYIGYSRFDFASGVHEDESLYTLGLVGGWIRQVSPKSQISAFLSPFISSELGGSDPEGVELYAGGLGLYRQRDGFTWLYGGVYEYSYGDQFLYPYLGFIWLPTVELSISLVAPWPSVSYAPSDRLVFRAGFVPTGSQWSVDTGDEQEANLEFGSWNLMGGVEYRLTRALWAYAGAGLAGFRGFSLDDSGDTDMDMDVDNDAVITVAINLRPPSVAP